MGKAQHVRNEYSCILSSPIEVLLSMPAEPYNRTQAEHSSDPPAYSTASREDASLQEEEREDAALKPEECIGKYICREYDGKV